MEYRTCSSKPLQRNEDRNNVQGYKCKCCVRQFLKSYQQAHYLEDIKQLDIRLYLKGMSTRTIEKLTDIYPTAILSGIQD